MVAHKIVAPHRILTQAEVLARVPQVGPATGRAPIMSEAAAPDVPAAVGVMIAASYAAIMLGFFLGFAHGADAVMMVAISALYTLVYVAVPVILLRVEGASGKVGLQHFLRVGIHTWTGHLSGREALAQMLLIPSAIAVAVFSIGIVVAFSR